MSGDFERAHGCFERCNVLIGWHARAYSIQRRHRQNVGLYVWNMFVDLHRSHSLCASCNIFFQRHGSSVGPYVWRLHAYIDWPHGPSHDCVSSVYTLDDGKVRLFFLHVSWCYRARFHSTRTLPSWRHLDRICAYNEKVVSSTPDTHAHTHTHTHARTQDTKDTQDAQDAEDTKDTEDTKHAEAHADQ